MIQQSDSAEEEKYEKLLSISETHSKLWKNFLNITFPRLQHLFSKECAIRGCFVGTSNWNHLCDLPSPLDS